MHLHAVRNRSAMNVLDPRVHVRCPESSNIRILMMKRRKEAFRTAARHASHRERDTAVNRLAPLLAAILLALSVAPWVEPPARVASAPANVDADRVAAQKLPTFDGYFIENRGQVDELVRYYSTGNPSVAFRDDGVMFVLRQQEYEKRNDANWPPDPLDRFEPVERPTVARSFAFAYMIRFEGANEVTPVGNDRLPFNSNFFLGRDSDSWRTDVPNYREVAYKSLYRGINLVFRSVPQGVKYEFVVDPGADYRDVRMHYDGVEYLREGDGEIVIHTVVGDIHDSVPHSYNGAGEEVACEPVVLSPQSSGFECPGREISDRLVIDPLVYSTFLGGSSLPNEGAGSVAVDRNGSAYVTGCTYSFDFPVTFGAYDTLYHVGYWDAFVSKLNPAGDGLVYSTFLGGADMDCGDSIALDSADNAHVVGQTTSSDFPVTPGAFDTTFSNRQLYIAKLSATGSQLLFSTFLDVECGGGPGCHSAVALDLAGGVYVTGHTVNTSFPTTLGAIDTTYNGGPEDAFVTKLRPDGSALVYSTFLGGGGSDGVGVGGGGGKPAITVNSAGNAFVTGYTNSVDFPITANAIDINLGGYDAYVCELDASGSSLLFSTYLGGSAGDSGASIALDSSGFVYVAGWTGSIDFPVSPGAFDTSLDSFRQSDVFVTKLDLNRSAIVYSTLLGGDEQEESASIAIDSAGNAYVTGHTHSPDFPTTAEAFDRTKDYIEDAFVAELNASGTGLLYSTFLGGNWSDFGASVALDTNGDPYVAGQTNSDNFPTTPGAFRVSMKGRGDAFVTKLHVAEPDLAVDPADVTFNPPGLVTVDTLVTINATIHNAGGSNASSVVVRFNDGPPSAPNQIGTDQVIPLIQLLGGTGNVSVVWSASPSGTHDICVLADPDDVIAEENETNNVACVTLLVQSGSVTRPDYVPTSPQSLPPIKVGLSSPVPLSIQVLNRGNGTATDSATVAFSQQSSPPFSTFVLSPLAPDVTSPRFTATWTSPAIPGTYLVSVDVDYFDNVTEWDETNNVYTWTIEVVSGPVTSLAVGSPNHTSPASVMYVRSSTPLDLSVIDQSGTGINHTRYRVDNVTWTEYSSSFFLSGEGDHYVEWYSEDNVGNVEETSWRVLRVDDTPPATAISIGEPKYLTGGNFVKSSTPLALSAVDGGVGPNSTFYRLWDDSWSPWREYSTSFSLAGRDGTWHVEFLSFDYLGNMEAVQNETLFLDDTPPTTRISSSAPFTLTATDEGCGVNFTMYRIDGGSWAVYSSGFTLAEGEHTIYYYSIDNLGNIEQERSLVVRPPAEVAVNYKPVVAVVFALTLLIAGVWSSRRKPWKGGKGKMAVVKAFMLTSMPFVLAEAATGVVSFLTGQLSIPPLVGAGTLVDSAVLVAGLVLALERSIGRKPAAEQS